MLHASDTQPYTHAPPAPPVHRMLQANMKARTAARAVPRGCWRSLPVLAGLVLAPSFTHAQAPDGWRWSTDVSAPGLDAALDVAADTSSQAVYTVGYVEKTSGLLDILLSLLLGSQYGGLDGFIAKYDADGIRQWSFLIGGTADDACTGVCVGPDGKIYVTGHFSGSATFGSGANLTSAGGKDIFVACYAPDGTLQWKVRGGGTGDDLATSIAFRSGKLFVAGSFAGTATIAGAASGTGLDPARRNTFIAAFRASDGTGLWRVDGGNANDSELNSICTDADRVYAIGRFKGTTYRLSTPTGALGTPLTTPAGRDNNGFVTALQQDGSFAWSAAISDAAGSDGTYRANGIGASATGVFITGSSHNGTTFPGNVTVNASGNPHDYAYVARLNRNTGATTWVRTMRSTGGGGSDHMQAGRDLAVDRNGDVCLTGSFRASIEFPDGTTATGTSDAQVFVAKFGSTGLFKWGLSAPGNHDDLANGIDSDGHAHLAVAGTWNDRILFDTELNDDGGNNLFLAQLTDVNFEVAAYRDPSRWNGFGPLCALDGPVDLTSRYIPAQAGAGIAVQSSSGIATPEGALGLNPGGQAIFDTNGDQLVIDFGNTIPAGEHVLMRWLRTGGGTATAQIEVSPDAVTFTSAGAYQTGQGTYAITAITVPVPTRYIRIRRVASGATFWVDGVFDDLGTEPGGTWSGAGVSGTTFTPTGLSGAIDLTYTVGTRSTTRSITVHPASNAGTITGGGPICPNTSATFALSGHTGGGIAWGISTNGGGNWSSTTTNASTFTLNGVGQPTQVRATVTSGTCPAATSAPVIVTPQDITPPTLSGCPGDITVNAIPGECRAVVNYALPTVTDDCTTSITAAPVDPAHVSGGTFLVGATTVVLQATDAAGNASTCSFTITVVDDAPPTVTCPADLSVPADAGACGAVVDYALPIATDNCSGPLTVQPTDNAYSPGNFFPVGTTTVQFQTTDAAGNSGTCSFQVKVVDAQPPVIPCPGDISVPADAGACGAVVSYPMPTATDACSGPLTVQPVDPARAPGSFFPVGVTTVQLQATDAAGNNGTCSFTVTVTDTQVPQFACPGNITVSNTPGLCGATVTYAMPTATDNCGGTVSVTALNGTSGTFFPTGTTPVTLSATDAAGNTSTCSFNVTVTDTEAPVVSGCADQLVEVQDPNACGAVVDYPAISATDNCGGTLTPVRTAGLASGSLFPFGTTTVVHQATHGALTGSCSFHVTVVDKAPPSFTLAPGPTLLADANCTATMPDLASLLTGLADCSGPGPIVQTPAVGATLTGTISATITVGDAVGNDTTVQVTVIVTDQTPPQITCPGPISVTLPMGQCSTQVFIPRPALSDNCDLVALTDSTDGIGSGSWFVPGTHSVTYTATDAANNQSSCQLSVSVLPPPTVDLAYPFAAYCADAGTVLPSVHEPSGGVFACTDSGLVLDASTGAIDPAASTPGTYTVSYAFAGPCSTQDAFTLTIAPASDAGTDGTVTLCSSASPIDLFAVLGGTPQAGGTWSGPASTTGTFDPAMMPGGTYVYTVNGAGACASRSASMTVTVVHEADATFSYPQGTYCATGIDPGPVAAETGGTFSAPAGLAIDASTGTIDLDASTPGTYTITHAFGGTCPSADTFVLQIDAPAHSDAGDDVHVCGLSAAMGANGIGSWSAPPGITIASPTDAASSVSASVGGTYVLTWSVSNGTCSATDDVSVTLDAPVAADAGDDQQVCGLNTTLAGEGNGTWSAPSGIVIDDPASAVSPVSATAAGTYTLTRTLINGLCTSTAAVDITFDAPVTVDAGDDIHICGLEATLPPAGIGTWSGPAEIGFQPGDHITASTGGSYLLTLSATNGSCTASDEVLVVLDAPVIADAGADQHICGLEAILAASGTGVWSGPSGVTIAYPNSPTSAVSATDEGVHTLIWTVVSGFCSDTDTVTVTFDGLPEADAGGDVAFCSLSGTLHATGSGTWSGPATVAFGNATDPTSSITADVPGTYVLTWTVTHGLCVAQSSINATFAQPSQAGNDGSITLCSDADAVPLFDQLGGAQPGGTWTTSSGAPHSGTYDPATDAPGLFTYTLPGTAPCPADAATVLVTEMTAADAGTDALLALCSQDAPVDLSTVLNGEPANGGSWTGPDGGPFSGSFDPAASVPGSYTYTVSAIAPCMSASATVTASVTASPDASWNAPSPVCSANGPLDLDALAVTVAGGSWSGSGVNGHAFDPASLDGEQTIVHSVTQGGCTATAEGTITVLASPVADAGNDDATCALTYALQATTAPGTGAWSAPDGGTFTDPAAASTTVHVDHPGTYRFIRLVTNGPCSDADTVTITFHTADQPANVDAGPDRVQNILTSAELTGTADGATTTHWSIVHGAGVFDDATALTTMVNGLAVGPNTIVLSAQAGTCPPRSDTLTITVNDLFIPTGFSPNGDGVNDTFEVVGVDVFADNTLTVFNRWGQVVYNATAYANQWDGRGDNGQELMDDTYYYVLKLDRASTYNGYLIIKR